MSKDTSPDCPPACSACQLRKTGAFTPVERDALGFIETFRSGTTTVAAGGTIIYEQRPNGKLFTLYSGWAFRYKTLSDGRRQILNFLLPGDFIGLQQEFADGAMHGIEAVTDVALCVFARDGLWDLFRNYPSLGSARCFGSPARRLVLISRHCLRKQASRKRHARKRFRSQVSSDLPMLSL